MLLCAVGDVSFYYFEMCARYLRRYDEMGSVLNLRITLRNLKSDIDALIRGMKVSLGRFEGEVFRILRKMLRLSVSDPAK